jgi:hypothetical protein
MAIATITAKAGAAVISATGGTDLTFTQMRPGDFTDLTRAIGSPRRLSIQQTIKPPSEESSYVIRYDYHKDLTNTVTGESSVGKLSAYVVIRVVSGDFVDAEVLDGTKVLAQVISNETLMAGILRGNA